MRLFPILTSVAAVAALTFGTSQVAQAAVIQDAITGVTVASATPAQNSQVTTTIKWCVPNGTKEGDTFTLALSSHLEDLPLGFELDDPKTGDEVASAVLSETKPAVITFTMTSYAASHLNTCGSAFLTSGFDSATTPSGVTTPFTFTTGDGTIFTTDVTPTGEIGDRGFAIKYGSYTRADQGRVTPADFLAYRIDTPVGPFDTATVTDVPGDQAWRFDCSTIAFLDVTTDADYGFVSEVPTQPTSSVCTPTSLTVEWGSQAALHYGETQISVSLPAATGVSTAPRTFTNVAAVETRLGTVVNAFTAPASNIQSSAGGMGAGTVVTAAPPTTPTPTPTPTSTPTPAPTASAAAAPAAVDATPVASDSELAYTGSNAALPLGLAGLVILLGLGFITVARRRSASRSE